MGSRQLWQVVNSGKIVVSSTPEELWQQAVEYFMWCDTSPVVSTQKQITGKNAGAEISIEKQRPYSIKGLCVFCGIAEEYLASVLEGQKSGSLYYQVINRIRYIIHEQNFTYAMVGEFNPIMTSKILNLDKPQENDVPVRVEIIPGLPRLANSENEILENINRERLETKNTKEQNL